VARYNGGHLDRIWRWLGQEVDTCGPGEVEVLGPGGVGVAREEEGRVDGRDAFLNTRVCQHLSALLTGGGVASVGGGHKGGGSAGQGVHGGKTRGERGHDRCV